MATAQQTFEFLQEPEFQQEPHDEPAPQRVLEMEGLAEPQRGGALAVGLNRELDRQGVLRQLRTKVGCISTSPQAHRTPTFSTGAAALDRLLAEGGLRVDGITEWVAAGDGSGAASLALIAVAQHLRGRGRGPLVVVSDSEHFYPPAAVALGIAAERIVWVRPSRAADVIWSIDQALRCGAVAAVWAPLGASLDDRDARRFQLAAEAGRTPGLFLRPAATRHRPSFAEIRFHVAPGITAGIAPDISEHHVSEHHHSRASESKRGESKRIESQQGGVAEGGRVLEVTLDRCRGGRLGERVWIRIGDQGNIETIPLEAPQDTWERDEREHEKAALHLASELAHPKISLRRVQRA